jgi:hypothetical protein
MRSEILGRMPPNYGTVTIEKVAINAVLAGCLPEYLPVVVASLEAILELDPDNGNPVFNPHGVWATTMGATPVIIVNGPIRRRIGLNCEQGAMGEGFRANATIGRAVRLAVRNIGGAKPQVRLEKD